MGRRWFGDRFDVDNTKTFDFSFPDLTASEPVNLRVYLAAASTTATSFTIGFGSNNLSAASARAARTCVLRFNNRIAGCTADLS